MEHNPDVSGLRDHAGYWLRRYSDTVHLAFERALARHGVSVAQWCVLVAIFKGQATSTGEVAAFVGVDQGAVTRVVDRLVDKGFVERVADPTDRRASRLILTARGDELTPRLAALADQNDARFFGVLDETEYRAFTTILAKLLRSAEIEPEGRWRDRVKSGEGEVGDDDGDLLREGVGSPGEPTPSRSKSPSSSPTSPSPVGGKNDRATSDDVLFDHQDSHDSA